MSKNEKNDTHMKRIKHFIGKAQLAEKMGVSSSHLKKLLNQKYFERLKAKGYQKNSRLLSPGSANFILDNEWFDLES